MRNLLTRSTSGFVYAAIFITSILYSKESFILLVSIFGIFCIYEFGKLIHLKNVIPYLIFLSVIALFYIDIFTSNAIVVLLILTLLASVQMIMYLYSKKNTYPKSFWQKMDASIRYLVFSLSFIILIPFIDKVYQPYILVYVLLLIWANDSFAFLIGKNFGRRKLFESVSPKKTIEGFIGGLVFSIITAGVIGFYSELLTITDWVIIAIITSVIGTIGDLVESKFKRQASIKDSGNIMPGHGGLLDRLDSLLFAAPFVYLYIQFII
ncbi:phosphatidate cytidylyltransferase [Flavobacteriaceae bacterium S356]|uniref:Phosphatidate cytidylyltransferase n=1 Tax=Asprobacillus argus TaxID=3076534 RepID=A0ABU3LGJ9_9FLAO|nr:phosphatidate cytidylyltransferase [Flavobacteriaceae bacterium S356]